MSEQFLNQSFDAPTSVARRMVSCVVCQSSYSPTCSPGLLSDQNIVITGGNTGVGFETAKSLALRGAHVILAARNTKKNAEAVGLVETEIKLQGGSGSIRSISLDLSNLDSVVEASRELSGIFGEKKIDQLIQNAGVWPNVYSKSPQGFEIAFATNILGPHLLLRRLQKMNLLREDARVIVVTGDIYIMAKDCTSDWVWSGDGDSGGKDAYCRSKLGLNWAFFEYHKRYPELSCYLVHPGVLATELTGEIIGLVGWFKQSFFCTPEQGAQTTLICATAAQSKTEARQPGLLVNGGYYHNTCGLMLLRDGDPAMNKQRALETWEELETICTPYLVL